MEHMMTQSPNTSARTQVLVIDDEQDICTFFRRLLTRKGYEVVTAANLAEATRAIETGSFQVAMVDLKLTDTDGLTLLGLIKKRQPDCEVIIMTGFSTVKTAVTAIQMGAYEYLEKPFDDITQVESLIEKASTHGRRLNGGRGAEEWSDVARAVGFRVGTSPPMRRIVSLAYKIANKNISVLIQGKTGSGKEVLARFIHAASNRANQPFIPVNCGALPETLLESELFGHEKGAFTGAGATRKGIFELAHRGTLFLDEIGEASPSIQVKLLRVLETGDFMRVGGERPIKSDVRVISATNVNLEEAIREKTFREDLFFRLNVVCLEVPTLASRREDIPLLAEHFIRQQNSNLTLAPATLRQLEDYPWPGNIRELANTLRRASVLCDGSEILPRHLGAFPPPSCASSPLAEDIPSAEAFWGHFGREEVLEKLSIGELVQMLHSLQGLESRLQSMLHRKGGGAPHAQGLRESEKDIIQATLEQHRWNITEAARVLGIARNTLHRKIRKYNLRGD
jgi:two-component system, NtrC family, response regulator